MDTDARTLIADNAWNAGIVIGAAKSVPADFELDGISGRVQKGGEQTGEGKTDDPMGALAWVANLAVERGRPMTAGMVVITGSVLATFSVAAGDTVNFALERIGEVEMVCV